MIRDAMISRSDAEWDALQDAIGTLWGWMKEGHTIRAQDVADFTLIDKCQREDEESATDAYSRGYEDSLRERGGDELVRLVRSADEARIESSTARAMEALANRRSEAAEAARDQALAQVGRLREALEPFAEPHFMGDAYVKFVENAREALADLTLTPGIRNED